MAGKNTLNGKARRTNWVPKPLKLSNGDIGVITEPLGAIAPVKRCRWKWTEGPKAGERCKRMGLWGIGLCDDHGGRDPARHEQLREALKGTENLVTLESMLKRLMRIMDANAALFHDEETGELLQPKEWPPEAWAIYQSAQYLNYNADPTDGVQQRVVELKVIDRRWAYELAAKIAGLIVERRQLDAKVQHEHKVSQPLVDALLEGQERAARHALPAPNLVDVELVPEPDRETVKR